jgi:hypothetical protein
MAPCGTAFALSWSRRAFVPPLRAQHYFDYLRDSLRDKQGRAPTAPVKLDHRPPALASRQEERRRRNRRRACYQARLSHISAARLGGALRGD